MLRVTETTLKTNGKFNSLSACEFPLSIALSFTLFMKSLWQYNCVTGSTVLNLIKRLVSLRHLTRAAHNAIGLVNVGKLK